ncbi:MAG: hypothetical protein IKE69_02020 [Thermoguttaceae bacterium]|nr:hypothetical protein [Thermoguttaceae bacterium]
MSVRPLLLCISLFIAGVFAVAAADEPLRYRYWMVPAEKISRSPWGDEKYYPVRMERFRRWLDALSRVSAEPSGALAEIRLEGTLADGALSEGEGEIRFTDKSPQTCKLTPCSVALSQLRWSEGGEGAVVSDGKGSVSVNGIAPEKTLLFAWSLASESEEGARRVFHFELPPAPAVSLRLTLPENLSPSVDSGLVTRLDEKGRWLIEPGPGGDFRLTLSENGTSPASSVPPSVSEQILCRVSLEGIELVYTARFTGTEGLAGPITLLLDEPFLPEKVEWESSGAAGAVWEKEGRIQKILIPAPPASSSRTEILTLTALAPFDEVGTLRLPPVRSRGTAWQETEIAVSFDEPTAPENYIFTNAGRSGPGGFLRLFKQTGTIEIPLVCAEEKKTIESATRILVTGSDLRFETDLFVRTPLSDTRRLTFPIKREWKPESVSVDGTSIPFRLETARGPAATDPGAADDAAPDVSSSEPSAAAYGLTLALEEPLSVGQPLKIRITGRRGLIGPTSRLSDYEPLVIGEPVVGAHLLALTTDSPTKISLVDGEGLSLTAAAVSEDLVRRLYGALPEGRVFSLNDSAPDANVRLEKDALEYTAELSGRVALYDGSISEEWNIHCVPPAGFLLDRILFSFNTNDSGGWKMATTQSGSDETAIEMRLATEDEREQYRLSEGRFLGEISLSTPRSAPFTVRLSREREASFSGGAVVPLPTLFGTSGQTARVDVSTPEFTPVRLDVRGLEPITPPPAEKGAASSALASYRYSPSEKGGYTLAVRDSLEDRRSGLCRFLRLESEYAATGTVRTRAICQIENTGIPSLQIDFPEPIELVNAGSVRGGNDPIPYAFHQKERKLEIPLPVEKRHFTLSFEYETRIAPFGFKGTIPRQVPRLNLPVLSGDWTANIPTDYRLDARHNVDLVRLPLDSPVTQYRLISRYRLRILQMFVFLLCLAFGLRLKAVHTAFLTFPLILLYFATASEVGAQVAVGVLAASAVAAIFNFFYHREPNGTSPADPKDDDTEIGLVPRTAAMLIFVLFGTFPLAADESYSIFVPVRDGQRVADEPVWISEELQSRLTEWERENAAPEGAARFRSAIYEGQLNYSRETGEYTLFHMTAKFEILTAGTESLIELPAMPIFQEGGILIDGVAGSVTMSRDDDRTRLELRGIPAGSHRLEFSLLTEPFGEKTPDGFFLPLPVIPDSKLLLRLPTDAAAPVLRGAMGQVSTSPGILAADLGQTAGITFFAPEKRASLGESPIEAEQEFRLFLAGNQIVLRGKFRLQTSGRIAAITFLSDPRYRLLRCTSPDTDLIPSPISESGDKVSITLRQPTSGKVTLHADFAPRDFSGVGELPLPTIRVDEASIRSNRLLMPTGYYPAEYDLTDPDVQRRSVSFLPAAPEPKMTESALYQFNLRDTTVIYHAALDTGGELWQLTLRIPQKSVIESLEMTDSRKEPVSLRQSEEDSLLHIFFDEPQNGVYQIDLRLRTVTSDRFPLTGILDIPTEETELRYEPIPSVYCDFTPPEDWTGLPAANGQKRWALPAAAASLLPPPISIVPNRPKTSLAADIFFYPLAENPDRMWELRADCSVRVESGQADRFEFEIDESFRSDSVRIEPAVFAVGIERSPGAGRRLVLTPNEPVRGETAFVLFAQVPGEQIRLPRLVFAGAARRKVQIRLPRAIGDASLRWQTANLEICASEQIRTAPQRQIAHFSFTPTGYFPHEVTEKSHVAFNMFQTYRPTDPDSYQASVSAENAVIRLGRVETEYHVRSDGSYWARAVYDIRMGTAQECDIQVPSAVRLLHAEAAGIPLAPLPGPREGVVRFRFASESSFVRLELVFVSATSKESRFRVRYHLYRELLLTAPIPVGTETAPTFWTVHFDEDARRLPYYVSQEEKKPDLKLIRKSVSETRSALPPAASGNWKYPIPADKAAAFLTRMNLERLSYLLDLIESADSKDPISPGGIAGWFDIWFPLYNQVGEYFSKPQRPVVEESQNGAFYDGRKTGSSPAMRSQSADREEFTKIMNRWEDLSSRIKFPPSRNEKNGGGAVSADEGGAAAASVPVSGESVDLLLFGAADKVRDIFLLIPTSKTISLAPFRTVLSIFAVLTAAAILVGGVRALRLDRRNETSRMSEEPERAAESAETPETDTTKTDAELADEEKTASSAEPGSGESGTDDPPNPEDFPVGNGPLASPGGNGATVLLGAASDRPNSGKRSRVETVDHLVIEETPIPARPGEEANPSAGTENGSQKREEG